MNVFDFDKTIYKYDSSVQFYFYCLVHSPGILKHLPIQILGAGRLLFKTCSKTECKELFYRYFVSLYDIDNLVREFWELNAGNIKSWYLDMHKEDDVIISASPEFLLRPICKKLGIKYLIASDVDRFSGINYSLNCHDEEKVRRFYEQFPDGVVDEFYSDSFSDTPMAKIAKKAYMVKGDKLKDWVFEPEVDEQPDQEEEQQ